MYVMKMSLDAGPFASVDLLSLKLQIDFLWKNKMCRHCSRATLTQLPLRRTALQLWCSCQVRREALSLLAVWTAPKALWPNCSVETQGQSCADLTAAASHVSMAPHAARVDTLIQVSGMNKINFLTVENRHKMCTENSCQWLNIFKSLFK